MRSVPCPSVLSPPKGRKGLRRLAPRQPGGPPGWGGVPGSLHAVGRVPEAACRVAHCVCAVCRGRLEAPPQPRGHSPPPARPGCASRSGRAGPHRPRRQEARPARAQPSAQSALLCSSAWAIDSPLPLSGRWQRSPERRGRGGPGDPRPAARRPSHPGRLPPERGCQGWGARPRGRLSPCFPHLHLCRGKPASIYFSLALAVLPLLVRLPLSVPSRSLSLADSQPPALGDQAPSPLPAGNSCVHTCPWRGGLAGLPSPGCLWGAGEPLPLSPGWACPGGGVYPWRQGEGAAAAPALGTIAGSGSGSIASLHTGASGAGVAASQTRRPCSREGGRICVASPPGEGGGLEGGVG